MRHYTWLLVVALSAPCSALADESPIPEDTRDAEPVARRHFSRGSALYRAGRYAEAASEFEAARAAKALPALDFNIGRCHDRLEHAQEAIDAYGRFVAAAPDDRDAVYVRARVAELRQQITASAPVPAPAPALATAPAPLVPTAAPVDRPRRRIYPWIVGGAGVALLAGSLASGLVAHARHGELADRCAPDGTCDVAKVPDAQGLIDGGRAAAIAADVLLGVGAAAVVTGAVLYVVDGKWIAERRTTRLEPTVGAHGGGVSLRGVW